jgi:hypothetical protein
LVQVDAVGAKPLQARVELGEDRLAGQAAAVGTWGHRLAYLRGDHDLVAASVLGKARPTICSLVPSE